MTRYGEDDEGMMVMTMAASGNGLDGWRGGEGVGAQGVGSLNGEITLTLTFSVTVSYVSPLLE